MIVPNLNALLVCCLLALWGTREAQAQGDAGVKTLRTQAKLVVVDVTVRDGKGLPVHGLTQKDFSLYEDGKIRTINSFQDHTTEAVAAAPAPKMPLGTFTNYVPVPNNNAVNVLLLDSLNTPLIDQQYVRAELLDFLKKEPTGARIAIFGLSMKLTLLQNFTSDPDVLRRIVYKQYGKTSPLLDDPTGASGGEPSFSDNLAADEVAAGFSNFATFADQERSFRTQARGLTTLTALNQLARYLSSVPGRKNLIWFSGSFPVNIVPDSDFGASDPFAAVASLEDEYRDTVNLFAAARVAIYPVDSGGLQVGAGFDVTGGSFSNKGFNAQQKAFSSRQADAHATMNKMADETGGRATYNSNGLSQAVTNAINDGSAFYTLTYTPLSNVKRDDFHKIEIKLDQPYTVNYRRGYFNRDDTLPKPPPAVNAKSVPSAAAADAPPSPPLTSMERAMAFSSPDATQMIFKFRVLPTTGKPEDKLAPENVANSKARAPFRRYAIDYAGDPRSVTFTRTPDGVRHGSVNVVALIYARDGTLFNSLSDTIDVNLTQPMYDDMLRHGLHYHQEVSVPEQGDFILRVGLHDLGSDRIGTAAIAIAAVKDLPALSTRTKAAAALAPNDSPC